VTASWIIPCLFAVSACGGEEETADDERAASPPPPASSSPSGDAGELLEDLTAAPEESMSGYSRERFPHWSSSDGCTTRQLVLRRDGEGVETDDECDPISGSWYSPYDGETLTDSSDVDIDHVVPLAEAWRSGAASWTDERREEFANDLTAPQLLATSASSNRSKGDQDPADWRPPREDYWCTYATSWIEVKHAYELTVDDDEREALEEMLGRC
jgi:hypothetical protein